MTDRLEKYMMDHKDEFDVHEPSPDLWKKIIPEEENKVIELKPKKNWKFYTYRVAAMLVVGLVSIGLYTSIISRSGDTDTIQTTKQTAELDPEIKELIEAESFYMSEVDQKMKELESYTVEFASFKDEILYDMAELDSAYNELKIELGGDINKKEVIELMIQNYRYKLDILEEILRQLREPEEEAPIEYSTL